MTRLSLCLYRDLPTFTLLLAVTLGCCGCRPAPSTPDTPGEPSASTPSESVTPDNPDVVAALKASGAVLALNARGQITAVDFRNVESSDEVLQNLSSLPELQQLFLIGPGFTSEGLKHLADCANLRLLSLEKTLVNDDGLANIAKAAMQRWFLPPFATAHPERVAETHRRFLGTDWESYALACEAIAAMDLTEAIGTIRAKTLVLAAADDPGTPLAAAEALRSTISGATLVVVPNAAHMVMIEQSTSVSAWIGTFLDLPAGTAQA